MNYDLRGGGTKPVGGVRWLCRLWFAIRCRCWSVAVSRLVTWLGAARWLCGAAVGVNVASWQWESLVWFLSLPSCSRPTSPTCSSQSSERSRSAPPTYVLTASTYCIGPPAASGHVDIGNRLLPYNLTSFAVPLFTVAKNVACGKKSSYKIGFRPLGLELIVG